MQLLLEYDADFNKWMCSGLSPLHHGVGYRHADAAHFLPQHGANVNDEDQDGKTALHWALHRSGGHLQFTRFEVTRTLLECGANVHARTN